MQTASIQARLPKDLKEKVESILKKMGLDMSSAIRIFFTKVAESKKIPFQIGIENDEEKFWNAMASYHMRDVWDNPKEDVWDKVLPKLPSIRSR